MGDNKIVGGVPLDGDGKILCVLGEGKAVIGKGFFKVVKLCGGTTLKNVIKIKKSLDKGSLCGI